MSAYSICNISPFDFADGACCSWQTHGVERSSRIWKRFLEIGVVLKICSALARFLAT